MLRNVTFFLKCNDTKNQIIHRSFSFLRLFSVCLYFMQYERALRGLHHFASNFSSICFYFFFFIFIHCLLLSIVWKKNTRKRIRKTNDQRNIYYDERRWMKTKNKTKKTTNFSYFCYFFGSCGFININNRRIYGRKKIILFFINEWLHFDYSWCRWPTIFSFYLKI